MVQYIENNLGITFTEHISDIPTYQHYLHLEPTLMGLVAVTACKYYISWEKLLQIPCAQIMEYVKR